MYVSLEPIVNMTNILAYFALSLLFLAAAYSIIQWSNFYIIPLRLSTQSTYQSLDGLRGFLALGVFFHHGVITFYYFTTGKWKVPPSTFYTLTGEAAVALFFMITGFLFWGKVIRSKGEINTKVLYASRIRRLIPAYIFSILCVLVVVLVKSGVVLHVTLREFVTELLSWLSFGFLKQLDINGVKETWVVNSVLWTLAYEWGFYILLPFIALFFRVELFILLALSVTTFVWSGLVSSIVLYFVFGALAVYAIDNAQIKNILRKSTYAFFPLVILIVFFSIFDSAYGFKQSIILFIFFVFVVSGNTLYGLLTNVQARFLGIISYSLYLFHSIVLYVIFHLLNTIHPISTISPGQFWLLMSFSGLLLISISALTYKYIEYPFIALPSAERKSRF